MMLNKTQRTVSTMFCNEKIHRESTTADLTHRKQKNQSLQMNYTLNATDDYHKSNLNSLGWELTVCNALYPESSPCRKALHSGKSFGVLLYQFLEKKIPLDDVHRILEAGGGLGNLMHDFLSLNPRVEAAMIDISPYLLTRQKETLKEFAVNFQQTDILKTTAEELALFDLIIMNENLGDLPTLIANPAGRTSASADVSLLHRANYFIDKYGLQLQENENINIGALEIAEKFCRAGVKYIYLSEHSCEAVVPEHLQRYLHFTSSGNPEKISLYGHDEYTVKFSFLQKIAASFDYQILRGCFADFLRPDFNDRVQTALRLAVPQTAEQEIIRQFIYDLYKYEYLLLKKNPSPPGINNHCTGCK